MENKSVFTMRKFRVKSIMGTISILPKTFSFRVVQTIQNRKVFRGFLNTVLNNFYPTTLLESLASHKHYVTGASFTPDCTYMATCSNDMQLIIYYFDYKGGKQFSKEIYTEIYHSNIIACINFSPSGKYLATGSYDTTARISSFNIHNTKKHEVSLTLLHTFQFHSLPIYAICFSSSEEYFATGSNDKLIAVYKLNFTKPREPFASFNQSLELHQASVTSLCFNYNDTYFASGSNDKSTIIYSFKSPRNKMDYNAEDINYLNNDDDLQQMKVLKHNRDHEHWVNSVSFSSDGEFFASASRDKSVKIYGIYPKNRKTFLKIIFNFQQIFYESCMIGTFSPDSRKYAVAGSNGSIVFLNLDPFDTERYGKENNKVKQTTKHIYGISFSPCSKYFVTGSEDHKARIYI